MCCMAFIFSPPSAFYLANEYLRVQGHPGFVNTQSAHISEHELFALADNFIAVAKGELDAKGLEDLTA